MTFLVAAAIAAALQATAPSPIHAVAGAPPQPAVIGELTITAPSGFVCGMRGNAYPATGLLYSCTAGGTTFGPLAIPLPADAGASFTYVYATESISFIVRANSTGQIQAQGSFSVDNVQKDWHDWVTF